MITLVELPGKNGKSMLVNPEHVAAIVENIEGDDWCYIALAGMDESWQPCHLSVENAGRRLLGEPRQ